MPEFPRPDDAATASAMGRALHAPPDDAAPHVVCHAPVQRHPHEAAQERS
ncbi:hypothetical protein ABT052_46600 [Streptomyces sp. NPDC002766]